jgi:hypothetical protein
MTTATFRRRLLLTHGSILTLVALLAAVATTFGRVTGHGPFGFMHGDPMVWVGLIQAYLLMTIISVLLLLGAQQPDTRKWHVVGALAHAPPLLAALSSLDVFASMGAAGFVRAPIAFHTILFGLETFAAVTATSWRRRDGRA